MYAAWAACGLIRREVAGLSVCLPGYVLCVLLHQRSTFLVLVFEDMSQAGSLEGPQRDVIKVLGNGPGAGAAGAKCQVGSSQLVLGS